jgi:hypothetical protein
VLPDTHVLGARCPAFAQDRWCRHDGSRPVPDIFLEVPTGYSTISLCHDDRRTGLRFGNGRYLDRFALHGKIGVAMGAVPH